MKSKILILILISSLILITVFDYEIWKSLVESDGIHKVDDKGFITPDVRINYGVAVMPQLYIDGLRIMLLVFLVLIVSWRLYMKKQKKDSQKLD